MVGDSKRKILKDVLGELDKTNTRTNVKATASNDDITGLEHKIPIVSEGIINFEEDSDVDDVEIPVPEGFSLDSSFDEKTDPGIEISQTKESEEEQEEEHRIESVPSGRSDAINKLELMEQKLLMLQEENKKQQTIIKTQRAELEEYTERLGKVEHEGKKLKAELSNADSNARMNLEAQLNRAAIIEEKYDKLAKHHEEMKAKVRRDIRKIRIREKELSNKLEMMKNDSETLLTAKDKKILQLKQQIDNLEFEIETLKEKAENLQELARENEEKAERVVKALRLSTSLLETANKKE
jgi:chromosome segregation ATPase